MKKYSKDPVSEDIENEYAVLSTKLIVLQRLADFIPTDELEKAIGSIKTRLNTLREFMCPTPY